MRRPGSTSRDRGCVPCVLLLGLLLAAAPGRAADCQVPGDHPTLHEAVADPTCTRILLADQTFSDSVAIGRTLDVLGAAGGSSTVRGSIAVVGGAQVGLSDLIVSGCSEARVTATGGGRVVGSNLRVSTSSSVPCPLIFADGFESGDASAWSSSVP
jgi:hypothetical protein